MRGRGVGGVVAGACLTTQRPPDFELPSLRTMQRGSEVLQLGGRRILIDRDAYILLERGADRSSHYAGDDAGVQPLTVRFAADAILDALAGPLASPPGGPACPQSIALLESLQPRDGAVALHLRALERGSMEQVDDELWWDERLVLLLQAALDAECALRQRERAMLGRKPTTRSELLRRVLYASDYIQSTYEQPISLHDIAAAAHLSRFHLVRLFRRAHGVTPHAYLTRKRVSVALRLMAQTTLGLDEIAARSGLGSRSSLFRHLRRQQGSGAAALRARPRSSQEQESCSTFA
jgi:AraC-like DNA-binding protein